MLENRVAYRKMLIAMGRIARQADATEAIFDLGEALYALGLTKNIVPRIRQDDPAGQRVIETRKWMADVSLEQLKACPPGSLGRVYAAHMLENRLDPNFYRKIDIADDTAFVLMRLRQSHDLWHVMSGFDASIFGEFGLQGFMLGQLGLPLSMMLLAVGMFRICINRPEALGLWMDTVTQGWQMGRRAKPVFGVDWELHWDKPLAELRAMYQVDAAKMIRLA